MDDWQSLTAIIVVALTGAAFFFRFLRRGKSCGGCGEGCEAKPLRRGKPQD